VPTYQYACTECGEPLEVVQKFSDDALTECPACGGRLRKVFSAAAIVFRGSGFYHTDSRKGAGSAATPAKEPAKKDAAKTDAKKESSSASAESSGKKSADSVGKSATSEKVA
jgi:putative FmdB family regulatory protein